MPEEQSQITEEPKDQQSRPQNEASSESPGSKEESKPGEEIQLNLKLFSIALGFVLLLAVIGGAITEFGP
ncbi:MAG: hypothetical protein HOJ22_08940 [Chloroflexi bacterium]|jgi:hypothetical protein|nr:hypothetical protein [Chloroflexota bacterium]MBT5628406.1 hypothetical protein [Chloroflexota bacterium]